MSNGTSQEWFKILAEIESPYKGQRPLEYQLHDLLLKAINFNPENKKEYTKECELLGKILVAHSKYSELHGQFSDIFGEYLTLAEKLNKGTGQFFTPTPIVDMMTQMTLTEKDLTKEMKICDPACGTGRFMLRTAKYFAEKTGKLNFLFVNIDIDFRVYVYCVMNAILNKIPSVVCWGNTLTFEFRESFVITPLQTTVQWNRLDGPQTTELMKKLSGFNISEQTEKGENS